jgi:hypothetical protein
MFEATHHAHLPHRAGTAHHSGCALLTLGLELGKNVGQNSSRQTLSFEGFRVGVAEETRQVISVLKRLVCALSQVLQRK